MEGKDIPPSRRSCFHFSFFLSFINKRKLVDLFFTCIFLHFPLLPFLPIKQADGHDQLNTPTLHLRSSFQTNISYEYNKKISSEHLHKNNEKTNIKF